MPFNPANPTDPTPPNVFPEISRGDRDTDPERVLPVEFNEPFREDVRRWREMKAKGKP